MARKNKKRTPKIIPKVVPKLKTEPVKKTKIRVIGIGGGGASIVSELATKVKKASFVAANTDAQALKGASRGTLRFQFGQNLTRGLGTGMNSELATIAAQSEKEKIKKLLSGQDLCIFVACLGGGTGSGATPIFAKISRNLGNISYGIFTLPFKFEGEKKSQLAIEALEKVRPNLNAISIIPNERIFQIIDKNTPLKTALSVINKNLAESLEDLIETIYEPGLINIDFADVKTVFEGRGRLTYLHSAEVSGLSKNEEEIKKILSSPLYPYTIRGAKGILFNIVGEKNIELAEVSQISKAISELVNREAKIIFGVSQKKGHDLQQEKGKIKVTILATGCGQRVFPAEETVKKEIDQRKKKIRKTKTSTRKTKKKKGKSVISKRKIKIKIKKEKKRKKRKGKPSTTLQKAASEEKTPSEVLTPEKIEVTVRRNALEVKKDIEAEEKELIAEEKKWETPAFLRRKLEKKENE